MLNMMRLLFSADSAVHTFHETNIVHDKPKNPRLLARCLLLGEFFGDIPVEAPPPQSGLAPPPPTPHPMSIELGVLLESPAGQRYVTFAWDTGAGGGGWMRPMEELLEHCDDFCHSYDIGEDYCDQLKQAVSSRYQSIRL